METLSDCVFEWMRREFAPLLGVCEQNIRPETPLSRFLPSERRCEFWRRGQRELGVRFPSLGLPPAMQRVGSWLTISSIGRAILYCLLVGPRWLILPLVVIAPVGTQALFHLATLPWATELPDLHTFADLSEWLLATNMKYFRRKFGVRPNRDEIFVTLKAMLIELGADPEKINPDATFTELLGC